MGKTKIFDPLSGLTSHEQVKTSNRQVVNKSRTWTSHKQVVDTSSKTNEPVMNKSLTTLEQAQTKCEQVVNK